MHSAAMLSLNFISYRLPVTVAVVLLVTPRSTSTWTTVNPRAASTVDSDFNWTQRLLLPHTSLIPSNQVYL